LYLKTRIDEIARAEFQRVDHGMSMRNFDFDIITKNGDSFLFNSIEKRELDKLMEYFTNKKITVTTVKEEHKMLDDDDFEEEEESEDSAGNGKVRIFWVWGLIIIRGAGQSPRCLRTVRCWTRKMRARMIVSSRRKMTMMKRAVRTGIMKSRRNNFSPENQWSLMGNRMSVFWG
jgi:hypothetical protein